MATYHTRSTIPGLNTKVFLMDGPQRIDIGQCLVLTAAPRKLTNGSVIDMACPCWLDYLYVMEHGITDETKTLAYAINDCNQRNVRPMVRVDPATIPDLYVSSSEAGGTASVLVMGTNVAPKNIKVKHTLVIKEEDEKMPSSVRDFMKDNPNVKVIVAKEILVWERDLTGPQEAQFLTAIQGCENHHGPCSQPVSQSVT